MEKEPYYGPSIASMIGEASVPDKVQIRPASGKPKPSRKVWVNQHTTTPERRTKRAEIEYIGVRQYKKIKRELKNHTLNQGAK